MEKNYDALNSKALVAMKCVTQTDITEANVGEDSSLSFLKEGNSLEHLERTCKMIEPWQVLLDLGHYVSYNYNYLLLTMSDFKDISELTMARTLLYLSYHHTGYDDYNYRLLY